MEIDIISDLHLSHDHDQGAKLVRQLQPNAELLVIAGDLAPVHWWQNAGKQILQDLCAKYKDVVFVAGNHEYYGSNFEEADRIIRSVESNIPNLQFLERETCEIGGIKFAGCTLWFPQDPLSWFYEKDINDFWEIRDFKPDVHFRNFHSQKFLRELPEDIDVIVTHHLFSFKSIHERYIGDYSNGAFLCEMSDMILDINPKAAIHGHSHIPMNYLLGDTHVISHPRGYPRQWGEKGTRYQPVTVEI